MLEDELEDDELLLEATDPEEELDVELLDELEEAPPLAEFDPDEEDELPLADLDPEEPPDDELEDEDELEEEPLAELPDELFLEELELPQPCSRAAPATIAQRPTQLPRVIMYVPLLNA